MNWIILYLLCFFAVIGVLAVGYVLNNQANACVVKHQYKQNKKGIGPMELSPILFEKNKTPNTVLVALNAKKTNYFSSSFNAIKLSPETIYSPYLFDLAIFIRCSNQAKKQQYNYITATLYKIMSIISKLVFVLFVPIVFIAAILNISFGLEKTAKIITIISLLCYIVVFLIQLILHFIVQSKVKYIKDDIKNLEIFEEDEINILLSLVSSLNKYEFFDITRFSLGVFALLNPATIMERKEK